MAEERSRETESLKREKMSSARVEFSPTLTKEKNMNEGERAPFLLLRLKRGSSSLSRQSHNSGIGIEKSLSVETSYSKGRGDI